MSYYWLNRQKLLQKTKKDIITGVIEKKAAEYYLENSGVLKEKAKNKYKVLSEEEKEAKRKYEKNRYKNMKENAS